jgi:hypothetical protein
LPDIGGYTPERGPLLSIDPQHTGPLLYGEQGSDTHFDGTHRLRLPSYPSSIGRRASLVG